MTEIFYTRFFFLVISFVASIFLLILRPNLMRILLGWDGLGVTSYLLVIYYFRPKSYNAGLITALRNRVGDVAILILIRLSLSTGTWNFRVVGLESPLSPYEISAAVITLAAITKRAQIPFSAWLPAAIAAPTPVSALVHSSTLVTAGVYLLIRFRRSLADSQWSSLILFFGSITMLIAGTRAIFEIDIKKIVALSTLRQLGLIIRTLGISRPDIAFFHLLTHAYFKALLFICAGNLIHCSNDYQDLRQIGSLRQYMPLTTRFINLSNLRLCGIPFMAGFYSKDIFLELRLLSSVSFSTLLVFFVATVLTMAYSIRFTILTSFRTSHTSSITWCSDKDLIITSGNWLLIPWAVIGGAFLRWLFFPSPEIIYLPALLKTGALVVTVVGLGGGWFYSNLNPTINQNFVKWTNSTIWILPFISSRTTSFTPLTLSWNFRALIDNSLFINFYHQTPNLRSRSISLSIEGNNQRLFLSSLQVLAIWIIIISLLMFIY